MENQNYHPHPHYRDPCIKYVDPREAGARKLQNLAACDLHHGQEVEGVLLRLQLVGPREAADGLRRAYITSCYKL